MSPAMLASLSGLYRLRGWGMVGALGVAATTAATAFAGTLAVPVAAQLMLAITASAQVVVLTPVLVAALRGTARQRDGEASAAAPAPATRLRIADDTGARVDPAIAHADAERDAAEADDHGAAVAIRPARVAPSR